MRFALTREKTGGGDDHYTFDATETDDQAYGPSISS